MSELDELMNLDPLSLTRDSPEIEKLIAHYRKQRADRVAGKKPQKEKGPAADVSTLLDGLKLAKPPSTGGVMRR